MKTLFKEPCPFGNRDLCPHDNRVCRNCTGLTPMQRILFIALAIVLFVALVLLLPNPAQASIAGALPLFATNTMTLEDFEAYLRRHIKNKCETFHLSFGIWKGHDGDKSNAMFVFTEKHTRRPHTVMLEAKNLRHALEQVDEQLKKINP